MDLSIIIVSFNTKQLLVDCLNSVVKSLKGSSIAWEIIVVDNGSTDGTRELLKKNFPQVRTIWNEKNVGFGAANNQGIKAAQGESILLLNSDTVVLNQAITKLLAFAQQHPRCFVGPKLLNLDRTSQSSCGPFFTLPVVFAALFLRGDRLGLTRWSPDSTRRVDWVSGACLMAPRKLFLDDLFFDKKIFMYMEEIDLLYRARLKGYRTYFYPKAMVVHLGTGSSPSGRKGAVVNIYRGLLYFYQKHRGKINLAILKFLLKLKALVAWFIGFILGRQDLKQTYAEAFKLV